MAKLTLWKSISYGNLLLVVFCMYSTPANAVSLLPDWVYSQSFKQDTRNKLYRVSPEQRMNRAEKYLKQGLHHKADWHLSVLSQNLDYQYFANYAKALNQTQQGQFLEALKTVREALKYGSGEYRTQYSDLEASLLVILAQEALLKNDVTSASSYLKYFVANYKSTPYNSTALTLIQQINQRFKPQEDNVTPLKVGLLIPLSGNHAVIGQNLLQAAQLALFDANNKHLLLYPIDTKGTPEGAEEAMQKAVDQGVNVVIGPLLGSSIERVEPIADSHDIILMPFSSDMQKASRYVFLNSFNPQEQARVIAKKAVDLGRKSFAALIPNTPYGQLVFRVFQNEINRLTGKEVVYAFYDPEKIDISPQLDMITNMDKVREEYQKELKALQTEFKSIGSAMSDEKLARLKEMKENKPLPEITFDALFIPAGGESLPLIASQLAVFDIDAHDVLLLGTSAWNDQETLKNRGEYLSNSLFPAMPYNDRKQQFEQAFARSYQRQPHTLAAFAYDSVQILHEFHQQYQNRTARLPRFLTREFGFNGVNGAFRFSSNGIIEHSYDLKSVNGRNFKTVTDAAAVVPPYLPANIQPQTRSLFGFSPWD